MSSSHNGLWHHGQFEVVFVKISRQFKVISIECDHCSYNFGIVWYQPLLFSKQRAVHVIIMHKNETNHYVKPNDLPFIKMARYVAVFMVSKKRTFEKIFEKPNTTYYKPWQRMLSNLNSNIESGASNVVKVSHIYVSLFVIFIQIW